MPGAKRADSGGKPGPPPIEVDVELVKSLCQIQCTLNEVASVLEIDHDTVHAALKRQVGMNYSEFFEMHAGKGRMSLRRRQYQAAMEGDRTMLVWLGKQWLGQKDRQEISSDPDAPMQQVVVYLPDNGRPDDGRTG